MSIKIKRELGKKACSKCGQMKPLEEYIRNRQAKDGRRPECKMCYKKSRGFIKTYRRRPENSPEGTLKCLECGEFKPLDQFKSRLSSRGTGKRWYDYQCKACDRKKCTYSYLKNRNIILAKTRDRTYKLAPGQYDKMLQRQNGKCVICGFKPEGNDEPLNVDHNHKTNTIRELLCRRCNQGIGFFKDNIKRLKRAIEYLERHK